MLHKSKALLLSSLLFVFIIITLILPYKIVSPELELICVIFHLPFPECPIKEITGESEG